MDNSIERIEVLEENELLEDGEQIEGDQHSEDNQRLPPQTLYGRGAAKVERCKRGARAVTGRGHGQIVTYQFCHHEAATSIRQPIATHQDCKVRLSTPTRHI